MTSKQLLENHISSIREVSATLREKKEPYCDQIVTELETRADEQEVYLILQRNNYVS